MGFVEVFAVVEGRLRCSLSMTATSAKSSGRLLAVWSLLGCSEQGVLFPEGSQVMVKELPKASPFKWRSQLNSTQEASKRRASGPGPVVHPTEEPQGQSPLRGATVRTVHYFHSTAQPQVSHRSGAGLMLWLVSGGRVGSGGRPVTTVKDCSLRTQAVNPKKGWEHPGKGSLKSQRL